MNNHKLLPAKDLRQWMEDFSPKRTKKLVESQVKNIQKQIEQAAYHGQSCIRIYNEDIHPEVIGWLTELGYEVVFVKYAFVSRVRYVEIKW